MGALFRVLFASGLLLIYEFGVLILRLFVLVVCWVGFGCKRVWLFVYLCFLGWFWWVLCLF